MAMDVECCQPSAGGAETKRTQEAVRPAVAG